MNVKWAIARAKAMSGREIGFRLGRAVRARAERFGLGHDRPPPAVGKSGRPWVEPLPRGFDIARYAAAADRILAGSFSVFALRDAHLGFPPRWNTDPKTGTRAPLVFGKTLDYRDSTRVGDIKYLWEVNRHLELVTLAQAWHLTGDARYAAGARTLIDSWIEQSPYPLGVNWCSSLEHAMRLASWAFAWPLLGADEGPLFGDADGADFRRRWLDSVHRHCHFIAGYMSRHSSANNHLLGEATGLFIAATTWPMWDVSRRWQARARVELERETLQQNFPDGVNKEQAVWYHHAVAEMLLLAGVVARANAADFSPAYWSRLEAMLEFLASIMDRSGHVPAFGDADDGIMVRLDPRPDRDVFRSLLACGAMLFQRAEFKAKARVFDDKTRWLFGDAAEPRFTSLDGAGARLPVRREFASGGYYILGDAFETEREVRIVADAGPLGYLSIAAHGHADALSFTLSAGGTPLLIDPGTFTYHTERCWRDYFRGTSAHNTVRVDGVDQSVGGGNFLWLRHAKAWAERFDVSDSQDRLAARHDGYERLADPVRHRRVWVYERATALLLLVDELDCAAMHRAEWFWHFAPGTGVESHGNQLTARGDNVQLTMTFPAALTCRLVAGSEHPPLGWQSPSLDVKVPTVTAVMEGTVERTSRYSFEVRIAFLD